MKNKKFLEQVADYLVDKAGDMSEVTVVCPNRRSAMFLKRYVQVRLAAAGRGPVLMPRFATMQALAERLGGGGSVVPDRWEALMALYDCYRRLLVERGREQDAGSFDRFAFWGEIILGDFDDIDRSLADASAVYTNLYRLREIRADYLTDGQRRVAAMLWGDGAWSGGDDIERFWMHTGAGQQGADRFVALWQVLGELYMAYRALLASRGMATAGMQLRAAVESVLATPLDELRAPGARRYVMAGLSDLCPAEISLLDRLHEAGVATFLWDLAPVPVHGDVPRAMRAVEALSRRYPMPADVDTHLPRHCERRIDVLGVPSATAQAKIAAERLRELACAGELSGERAISTAVVVPDESLLMPLMLALPENLDALNVTMALPYSTTTFATLLRSITAMQARARQRRGRWTFYYRDVLEILSHPHVRLIGAADADAMRAAIMREGMYNVDADVLAEKSVRLAFIFRPVQKQADANEAYTYTRDLVDGLRRELAECAGMHTDTVELQMLEAIGLRLDVLHELMGRYRIEMGDTTFFGLFERLLTSGVLTVTGTPLRGLQVMGVLETRALDFDNIIFLSMNERTMPRRDTVRTMIPNALRRGYGLPPVDEAETATSYCFYRAIARARNVTLIYDSRPAGKGAGEVSRYVTQLLYGGAPEGTAVSHSVVDLSGDQPSRRTISVPKTPEVMAELEAFRRPNGLNLSASALKTYMICPLSFYLKYVKGYRDEDEPTEYMSAAMAGDVFHRAMCTLYKPWRDREITAEVIDGLLAGDAIRSALLKHMAEVRFGKDEAIPFDDLPAEARLIVSQLEMQLRGMLEAEKDAYCHPSFTYIDGERDIVRQWTVTDNITVNFRMQIDRIDRQDNILRFVDYKTGKDDYSVGDDISNLFGANHKKHALFQLLLYCEAYADLVEPGAMIQPALHLLRGIMSEGKIMPLKFARQDMPPYPALKSLFRPLLNDLVTRIFDDTTPFGQPEGTEGCKFCPFLSMCGRNLPTERSNE